MSPLSAQEVEALVRDNVADSLGVDFQVLDIAEGRVDLRIPFAAHMTRLGGTISGPILMTAADTAMYAAVIAHVDNGQYGVTSHMNFEFLRRPPAADLLVRSRLLRSGRRQAVCSVEITSAADSRLVAHVTGAYALFDA